MYKELITAVYPGPSLVPEWADSESQPSHSQLEIEEKTMRLFDPEKPDDPYWLLVLGSGGEEQKLAPSLAFWRSFACLFVRELRTSTEGRRGRRTVKLPSDEVRFLSLTMPPMPGAQRIDDECFRTLWNRLHESFEDRYNPGLGSVDEFFASISPTSKHSDRVHFHLVDNRSDPDRPFAFLATYATIDPATGKLKHFPLSRALDEFRGENRRLLALLSAVKRVAAQSAFIAEILDSGELYHPLGLTVDEAYRFLQETEAYEAAGILCRIPRWWNRRTRSASFKIEVGTTPTKFGKEALLDYSLALALDGETLTDDEIRHILEDSAPLAMLKGRWIAVDRAALEQARAQLEKARALAERTGFTIAEALRLLSSGDASMLGLDEDIAVEVSGGEWISSVLERLRNPAILRDTPLPAGLTTELRPYQQTGFRWLSFLQSLGFGGCLADDMGLGKTVQMIALFLARKETGDRPQLVIAPTSLLENWKSELYRFAPSLACGVLHSSGMRPEEARDAVGGLDVLVTTYGMAARVPWLADFAWDTVVLDEAQAIKNARAAQTRAVKKIRGRTRFVMTGTPVENRLSDLWSIFDFIDPGLLGTQSEFRESVKSLADHPYGYGRLRSAIQPYMLRRLKTDKSIIDDLPEKIECKTFADLTKKQAVLYGNLVSSLTAQLEAADNTKKAGIIFSHLVKFKQLCNHPDQYEGSSAYAVNDSGKFAKLVELCEKINEEREKVLVFTQFAEIVEPLADLLETVFGIRGVTLTGAASVQERKTAVARFQNDVRVRYFVLSVRAGGVGLNLTAGNHVIHFDRWWNPAVENQATDRAFRIGQKRNVVVHKFVTAGTIEEKIDRLIEEKQELAGEVIGTAEADIAKMSDDQIVSMFTYSFR